MVADDADRIGSFTTPGWSLVTPESGPIPSVHFLDAVSSGPLSHSPMQSDVNSVRVLGDVAVVVSHSTNSGTFIDAPFSAVEWVNDVLLRIDAGWRCTLTALTPDGSSAGK